VAGPYGIECEVQPATAEVREASQALAHDLKALIAPMLKIAAALRRMLTEDADELASPHRMRAEAALRGIERRARLILPNWVEALDGLAAAVPAGFVDWLGVERNDGHDSDIGFY